MFVLVHTSEMALIVNNAFNKCLLNRFYRRKHVILWSVLVSTVVVIALHSLNSTMQSSQSSSSSSSASLIANPLQNNQKLEEKSAHQPHHHSSLPLSNFVPPLRLVHIDLKGAPPKLHFYSELFPVLRSSGANAILLEYEDMFPFWGPLSAAKAHNAYSRDDISALLAMANENGLEVIPLIQSFGHLEFALKLSEFAQWREVDHLPQAICPLRNGSFAFVQQMVDQVLSLHPHAHYLHIGCDEVYHMGLCDTCRQHDREQLFLTHVYRVAQHVVRKHARIPIIWDDMLRQIPSDKIKASKIAELGVEPMIWTYIKDVYRFIPYSQWMSFGELFPHVWTASAFKGAFGETLTVPNIRMHLENNIAWLEVMREQKANFRSIRGLALTGWQRYDHLAALCELLPAAMPSLVLNLLTVTSGHFEPRSTFKEFDRVMHCTTNAPNGNGQQTQDTWDSLDSDPYLFARTANCHFPGGAIYRLMQTHSETVKRVNDYLYDVTVHKAWLTQYNIRHNISSPFRVDEGLQDYASVYYGLESLLETSKRALREVYDEGTVAEWIEQNVWPHLQRMEKLMNDSMAVKRARYWPKRPLNADPDLERRLRQ